ncbi:MAG TPA: hypothetical protein VF661_16775 [Actinomycetales bacterium]
MTWRQVGALEWRRTGGPLVAVGLLLVGAVLFAAKQRPFYPYATWSSGWADALAFLNDTNIVLGPVVATVAAWSAGRERRRRMDELLASTARPSWQRRLTTLVAVTAGLVVGWLLQAAVVLGAVFPSVSYFGGRWPATLLLLVLGIVVCIALGFAVGRRAPGRLVPPLLGLAVYVGIGILTYVNGHASTNLAPIAALRFFEGQQLKPLAIAFATTWFVAVACGFAVLGVGRARHWPVAVGFTAVALASALVLTSAIAATPRPDDNAGYALLSWIEPDPAAAVQVCTDDTPVVCVQQVHAGLLAYAAPVARRELAAAGRRASLTRVEEIPYGSVVPDGVLALGSMQGLARPYRSGLEESAVQEWLSVRMTPIALPTCGFPDGKAPAWFVSGRAAALALVARTPAADDAPVAPLVRRLRADPTEARTWLRTFLIAAHACDRTELRRLADA